MGSPASISEVIKSYQCAIQDMSDLMRDSAQRNQIWQILKDFGINLTLKDLFKLLLGIPLKLLQAAGDEIVFQIQTDFSAVLTINIIAD